MTPGDSITTLQLWNAPSSEADKGNAQVVDESTTMVEVAEANRLATQETWRPFPPRNAPESLIPFSPAWFEFVESRRYKYQGRWIPRLLEVSRHAGDKVLCLGDGLGTDWLQFAKHGAQVSVCLPTASQLTLIRKHFKVREQSAQFWHGTPRHLPVGDNTMDVVCSTFFSSPEDWLTGGIDEIYRVLRPGGKIIAVVPAWYNSQWWESFWFPWLRWFVRPPATTSEAPLCYSGRQLHQLFAAFDEPRVYKRHLRRSELPYVWRGCVLSWMERVMGRYLILKAFKPLRAALTSAPAKVA